MAKKRLVALIREALSPGEWCNLILSSNQLFRIENGKPLPKMPRRWKNMPLIMFFFQKDETVSNVIFSGPIWAVTFIDEVYWIADEKGKFERGETRTVKILETDKFPDLFRLSGWPEYDRLTSQVG